MQPQDLNDEARQEELSEDNGTPFQAATPSSDSTENNGPVTDSTLDATHPATDGDLDSTEVYDAGVSAAAGASDDSTESDVLSYDPSKDQRRQQ
jgi:hypothetical protein